MEEKTVNILIFCSALTLILMATAFSVGYRYQDKFGTDRCKLENVTCFDYKDVRLMRLDDFELGNVCYTIDAKTVSCVRR